MASAVEIANAYVALTIRMPRVQGDIEKNVSGVDMDGVGNKLGKNLGGGISKGTAAMAGAIGGVVASIANRPMGALSDLVGEAISASDATDKFKQTLEFAGLDTSAIESVSAQARKYADQTVYDLGTIQNTTAQLAANGVEGYADLTEAAGNLNAIAGGNAQTFESVAMMLSQTAGAGKLTTENWNQLANAIPGASGVIMDALAAAGAYTGNFRDAMAAGEITAEEFNAALMQVGQDPIAVEAAKSVSTMEGATGNLAAAITGVLADAFSAIKPAITGFTALLADFISNSNVFIPVISGVAGVLLAALAPALVTAATATWGFTAALLANPLTWIVLAIGALIAGIVALAMNWDTVTAWITDVWSGFIGWITGVIDGFVGWWNGIWAGVGQWISDVWSGIVTAVTWYFNALFTGFQIIGAAIAGWWNGLWNGISSFFTGIWNGIIGAIQNVQNAFNIVFTAIGNIVRGAFEGVVGFVKGVINGIIDAVNGVIGGINGVAGAVGGALGLEISIPKIPRLADGGIISGSSHGTLALVGEAGRGRDEAVIPLPADWKTNGLGGGTPKELIIVDADRQLIGRMRVEADNRVGAFARAEENSWAAGAKSL